MCSYVYECLRGYSVNQKRSVWSLPANTSHIISFKNEKGLAVRNFTSVSEYTVKRVQSFEMPYNKVDDKVYTDTVSVFDTLSLTEFMHYVLPGETVKITTVPVSGSTLLRQDNYWRPSLKDYKCTCSGSTDSCVFHNFIREKLYEKYKNDIVTSDTNGSNVDNNDWCMV